MAAISGKKGLVMSGGVFVGSINNWSLDIDSNMLDITTWTTGVDQWRSITPGLSGASGTFSGLFDSASTAQDDIRGALLAQTTATIRLELDHIAGAAFTGGAYYSGGSFSADIDGTADVNYSFTYNGAVSFTTST